MLVVAQKVHTQMNFKAPQQKPLWLRFDLDEKGLISHWEIKKKVDQLLGDENSTGSSQKLKEMVLSNIAEGGQSHENFSKFQ
ncbi:hypothetical protein CR513_08921, partial [Mucuna pruriens]